MAVHTECVMSERQKKLGIHIDSAAIVARMYRLAKINAS